MKALPPGSQRVNPRQGREATPAEVRPQPRLETLWQALMAPRRLAMTIDEGLGWKLPAILIVLTVLVLDFSSLSLFLKGVAQTAPAGLSGAMLAQLEQTSRVLRPIQILLKPLGSMSAWLFVALLFHLIGIAINHRSSFRKLFTLTVFASLVVLVKVVLKSAVMWVQYLRNGRVNTEPAIGLDAMLSHKDPVTSALFSHANFFEVWLLIVLISGVSVLCHCRKRQAALIVLPVWALALISHAAYALLKAILIKQLGA